MLDPLVCVEGGGLELYKIKETQNGPLVTLSPSENYGGGMSLVNGYQNKVPIIEELVDIFIFLTQSGIHTVVKTKQDEVKRVSHQALKPQKPRYNCQCKK